MIDNKDIKCQSLKFYCMGGLFVAKFHFFPLFFNFLHIFPNVVVRNSVI